MLYIKTHLTHKEKEIYEYILNFKQTNGYSPSWNEIAHGVCTSKSYVQNIVESLQDKGLIKYQPKKYRSITVIKFLNENKNE